MIRCLHSFSIIAGIPLSFSNKHIPNSLAAYLISVHMGFRTLALNERAGEIMTEFGKLKKEFANFGSSTEELQKKTDAMLRAVNEHAIRERQMNKAIQNMDQLDS